MKRRYPILNYKNEIGLFTFVSSIAGMILTSYFYLSGFVDAWLAVFLNMLFTSFLHELEHDLTHSQYYSKTWIEEVMKWGVSWSISQPHVNLRKRIHLLHHKVSGQYNDAEELWFGNGMPWGLKRLIVSLDQNIGQMFYYGPIIKKDPSIGSIVQIEQKYILVSYLRSFVLYFGFSSYVLSFITTGLGWQGPEFMSAPVMLLQNVFILWGLPNYLRYICLGFVTASSHYHGDIRPGDEGMMQQNQVMNAWYMFPVNLFTFNFGSTHIIHHYVVNQPFYMRDFVKSYAFAAFKKYGVRFNDFGTHKRANRYDLNYQMV